MPDDKDKSKSGGDKAADETTPPSGTLKEEAYKEGVEAGPKVGRVMAASPSETEKIKGDGDEVDLMKVVEKGDVVEYVTLKEAVVEEFYADGAKRPSHRVLYHAGQTVKKSDLEAIAQASKS